MVVPTPLYGCETPDSTEMSGEQTTGDRDVFGGSGGTDKARQSVERGQVTEARTVVEVRSKEEQGAWKEGVDEDRQLARHVHAICLPVNACKRCC